MELPDSPRSTFLLAFSPDRWDSLVTRGLNLLCKWWEKRRVPSTCGFSLTSSKTLPLAVFLRVSIFADWRAPMFPLQDSDGVHPRQPQHLHHWGEDREVPPLFGGPQKNALVRDLPPHYSRAGGLWVPWWWSSNLGPACEYPGPKFWMFVNRLWLLPWQRTTFHFKPRGFF